MGHASSWIRGVLAVACIACSRPTPEIKLTVSPDAATAAPPSAARAEALADADIADAPALDEPQAATVTLLDPGRAPRVRLHYAWKVRQKERLTMDLRTALSNDVGDTKQPEIPLPPVRVIVDVDPQTVSPDGELLAYAWHVTWAATIEVQAPPQVTAGMRAEVAAIEHLRGTGEVDWLGLSRDVSAEPIPVSDAGATGQMVDQIKQTLRDMAAPFPLEAIGLGARWKKVSRLAARDARITQSDTFTLNEIADNAGTLEDTLAQTAPPQILRAPGAPEGAEARMESMLASGNAKIHFNLLRLVPQTKFDGTTTMVLSGAAPQETARHMTMTLRVEIVLAGSIR